MTSGMFINPCFQVATSLKAYVPVVTPAWACVTYFHTSSLIHAARKGTRAKAEAKKKASKKVEIKKEFIPLKKRLEMQQSGFVSPRRQDSHLKDPIDDVWIRIFYRQQNFSFLDVLAMHRETHHPTLLNRPNSILTAKVELTMATDKKNRFLDNFSNVVKLPYDFKSDQEKTSLVITRNDDLIMKCQDMDSVRIVGPEIIALSQKGEMNLMEFDYILTDVGMLPELVAIRGLMKKKFPNIKNGTASSDLFAAIDRFTSGVEYNTVKDKYDHDYAIVEAPFGNLTMPDEHLEKNFEVLIHDIEMQCPPRKANSLITLVKICCAPSREYFKVDHTYFNQNQITAKEIIAVA